MGVVLVLVVVAARVAERVWGRQGSVGRGGGGRIGVKVLAGGWSNGLVGAGGSGVSWLERIVLSLVR